MPRKYTKRKIIKTRPVLLKKGKGLQRIPMSGLRQLESAGKRFQKVTGRTNIELKQIRKEIKARTRR